MATNEQQIEQQIAEIENSVAVRIPALKQGTAKVHSHPNHRIGFDRKKTKGICLTTTS